MNVWECMNSYDLPIVCTVPAPYKHTHAFQIKTLCSTWLQHGDKFILKIFKNTPVRYGTLRYSTLQCGTVRRIMVPWKVFDSQHNIIWKRHRHDQKNRINHLTVQSILIDLNLCCPSEIPKWHLWTL